MGIVRLIPDQTRGADDREHVVVEVSEDGLILLAAPDGDDAPARLSDLDALQLAGILVATVFGKRVAR